MVDYSSWKSTNEISVTDLQLDRHNPRIPEDLAEASQNDIISIMVERYNILPLAESISKNGFEPREQMIVVWEDARPVVVEGNRRLTALKLLINPALAPIKVRQKYQGLHDQIEMSAINKPYVLVAPSRESTDPIVLSKHTTNTEIPWKPLMQSVFYERKIKQQPSLSLDQIADKLNIDRGLLDSALLRLNLYRRLLLLVSDDVKPNVEDQEKFDITTIERFTNNPTIRKLLRVSVKDNVFVPTDPSLFDFVIKCLTEWMFKGPGSNKLEKITSRTANTVDQMKKYVGEAKARYKNNTGEEENADQKEPDDEPVGPIPNTGINPSYAVDTDPSSSTDSPNPPPARKKQMRRMLIEENQFSYTVKGRANAKILKELQYIQIDKSPNVSAIVFRVFLERIIRQFLANHKVLSIEVFEAGEKKKKKVGDVAFGAIIDYITTRQCRLIGDDGVKKALKAFKGNDAAKPNSLCNLNTIIHYQGKLYTKSDVRELVDSLESTIDYFTTNPEPMVVIAPQSDENDEKESEYGGSGDGHVG